MPHRIEIVEADITTLAVDAIVNAANSTLLGGGGVDGAIHRAAGPELLADAARSAAARRAKPRSRAAIGCRPGMSSTPSARSGRAAGPVRPELLANAYANSLALARTHGLVSIAFPAISTGVYGYPAEQAADIAVGTVVGGLRGDAHFARVVFCCFGRQSAMLHEQALRKLADVKTHRHSARLTNN